MVGSAACNRMIAADKCTFTSALKSGSLRSGSRAGRITPALWITIVTAWSRVISAAARLVASASARSTCTCFSFACARPEGCTSSDTTSWPASSSRRAIARPIPALPPVMTAVLTKPKLGSDPCHCAGAEADLEQGSDPGFRSQEELDRRQHRVAVEDIHPLQLYAQPILRPYQRMPRSRGVALRIVIARLRV